MGSWVTKAYTFVESSGSYSVVTTNLTGKFLTAKLTKNLGDTAKFNFSLPYADGKDLFRQPEAGALYAVDQYQSSR